ncbi:Na+/H+ antiporter NhaC family protein [Microcoleus sp. FACHB-1515]|nr:Na+/H+ antiporter NhaC family protein [Microcoleus sp. FACHB-1515]
MDLLIAIASSFALLVLSTRKGIFIAYPLLAAMIIFIVLLMQRGFSFKSLLEMAFRGSKKSTSVFSVLLMIGVVTAVWMAAGTVPAIVYYGIQFINPKFFILAAFLLTSFVSLLIGTSFGTVSTIGIALMIMASSSGMNLHLVAGAIIAGAYVGDRCSPMSSSANLIASVTKTNLYSNVKRMWRTSRLALSLSIALYTIFSLLSPAAQIDQKFATEIDRLFQIGWIELLPAAVILILAFLQIEVKRSMLVSIAVASVIALTKQHYSLFELAKFAAIGFRLEEASFLQEILTGGGLLSMLRVTIVVIISTAFVGIFAETQVLGRVESWLDRIRTKGDRFLGVCAIGTGAAAFGCTQTIAILLTQQLVRSKYKENETDKSNLAIDLENTVVVISPLVPWNIAGLVPATILSTDANFIPFAFYLYLLPLLNLIALKFTPQLRKLCSLRPKKKTSSSSSLPPF